MIKKQPPDIGQRENYVKLKSLKQRTILLYIEGIYDNSNKKRILQTSFDFKNRDKIDSSWATETESRIDAYESGKMGSRPVSNMFAALQIS